MPKEGKKKKKRSREEQELSDLLFGNDSLIIDKHKSEHRGQEAKVTKGKIDVDILATNVNSEKHEEEVAFDIDRNPSKPKTKAKRKGKTHGDESAWVDDDDSDLEVDLKSQNKLKKLQKPDSNGHVLDKDSKVSGTELSNLLKERFIANQALDWVTVPAGKHKVDDVSELLNSSRNMVVSDNEKRSKKLPEGRIDIARLVDANAADVSKSAISSVTFHHEGNTLMVGSEDRHLRFFRIDGDKNEKVSSIRFAEMKISRAAFLGLSNDVVVSGRKPYFYHYDGNTGKVIKIPGPMGKGLKSHEGMTVSPEGSRIAFSGAGGYTHVLCGRHKTWQMDVKSNSAVRSACFADENTLYISGLDADVYQFDLRMHGRCLSRFKHEDGTCSSALAVSRGSNYLAVGAESGAVSLFDAHNLPLGGMTAKPLKSVLNLVTKVTCLQFHPSSQLLALSSPDMNDQLRLLHLPSYSVFTNWPTNKTPLRKVSCVDFSPNGGYMVAGNDRGRVLLYTLNHFLRG